MDEEDAVEVRVDDVEDAGLLENPGEAEFYYG